jgi:hypothetical protein
MHEAFRKRLGILEEARALANGPPQTIAINFVHGDGCGDWAAFGKHGRVYAVPEGYQLMVFKGSAAGWTHARQRGKCPMLGTRKLHRGPLCGVLGVAPGGALGLDIGPCAPLN